MSVKSGRPRLLQLLIVLWLAAYAASFLQFALTGPAGDGFTRGLNRVMAFLGWQIGAGLIGCAIWIAGRDLPLGRAGRWLLRIPALLALALATAILALVLWARLARPAPAPPEPAPVTMPVTPSDR